MLAVRMQFTRFVDEWFPGWVECQFTDAHGRCWTFVDKVPIFTTDDLRSDSQYPQPGTIACMEVGRRRDEQGRELVRIDTGRVWGVASLEDETQFEVLTSQLTEI
jgi:hypothetical protein